MERRTFFKNGMLTGAALISGATLADSFAESASPKLAEKFNMKFSPEFGIFSELSGKDPIDQIKWGYDQGFRAWESTGLRSRPVEEQERISAIIQQKGMEFGQFVGTMTFKDVTFAGRDADQREKVLSDVRSSVEVAKRMNTKFIHNVLGCTDIRLPWDFQMANAIELLKRIAEIYEPHGIVMVMESMNHRRDHPEMFLHTIPQAYALAKAVGSPSVKVLYDFYHVQIQEGNLLPTLDYAWDEIAYIQVGDTPGRAEPTSGEINYPNVLQHLHDKGYRGFVGLEHGISKPGKEGTLAALNAYRAIDPK
ncbi:hydroxypyruvate isomerase family protein [Algoriphagus antarcticus]|uniref:Hydroxypyruvate isomerase n=1 Tax=Algoriphagus antarcticus TaxID=238540 RepID=A0A3E0E3V3_9BACT|nr:TIM barrel protein [Algoriphagus antarcticus]REG92881.1 hydroxypyruvate isomerase [Algoriphagus antarcticus]